MKRLILSVICLCLFNGLLFGQFTPTIVFKHLSTSEGLSNNNIKAIFRDSRGFLWIGTESGLNLYDGYRFTRFYQNNSQLSDDAIQSIAEDPQGNIWIYQTNGYNVYKRQSGTFTTHYKEELQHLGIDEKTILQVGSTLTGDFWAYGSNRFYLITKEMHRVKAFTLTEEPLSYLSMDASSIYYTDVQGKLYMIDKQTSEKEQIFIPETLRRQIGFKEICCYADNTGNLWLWTYQNSNLIRRNNAGQWETITLPEANAAKYNRIQQVLTLQNGTSWILTTHTGLYIYRPQTNGLENLRHDPLKPNTLASDNLSAIYQDHTGTVWIGNFKHGLSYYSQGSLLVAGKRFLEFDDILSFSVDRQNQDLYFGTDGKGLIRHPLHTETYEPIQTPANIIVDLHTDMQNRLWAGTYQKGLLCINHGKVKQYTTLNSQLKDNDVYAIRTDLKGYLWIGTLNGYIQRFNPDTGQFETLVSKPGEMSIRDMCFTSTNILYVATDGGIVRIDTKTLNYKLSFLGNRLKEKDILTLYEDSRGWLWIGHPHGLSIWNPDTDTLRFLDYQQGLTANLVRAITEDNFHNLWIGTGNGVTQIDVLGDHFYLTNYTTKDGLVADDINIHAILKLANGSILMGTPKGYQTLLPQAIKTDEFHARTYLTGIELKTDTSLTDITDGQSLETCQSLTLQEHENNFTLYFSTLNLTEPNKIRFSYRLNRQGKWTEGDRNRLVLSMLPAGNYQLQVRACNQDGIWSDQIKEIGIRILPPWWRSHTAYAFYFLAFIGLVMLGINYYRSRQKQNRLLTEIEAENEKQQKLSEMKLRFFANISHELRTPLSLIINPLEEFVENYPEHRKGLLELVRQNADYLLELINQLLDFRRLDTHAETLHCERENMLLLLTELYRSFEPIASRKQITFRFEKSQTPIYIDFDYDKMRKVFSNLLSNAFKFTPQQGCITLKAQADTTNFYFSIADTGCGIDDESKPKIFQRFYQSTHNPHSTGGSGIGLHITSEYIRMHGGNIQVSDNHPTGTLFSFHIPLQQVSESHSQTSIQTDEQTDTDARDFTILLTDDHTDFLHFLAETLSKDYRIFTATNGKEAFELLEKEDIDLVISDVMMPEMDGLELCRHIKTDIRFSHIPIILLTAKSSEEHQLEGLSNGADDYITKPFSKSVLKLKIEKIIEKNAALQAQFKNEMKIEPSRIHITPLDQQLVQKAVLIVEANLSNPDFSVEELATQLNISRSYFYKKLIKITGKKPIEFIRMIRLKRAQQWLCESQMQIAEIAYLLGYNSPKLFSKQFKEEFGMTPTEFIKQHSEK